MENTTMTPKKIVNKYDLMHLNTPAYARTTVEWDCSRLSPITKNRVLRWLADPTAKRSVRGDAADMYRAVRRHFGIPIMSVPEKYTNARGHSGWTDLRWENPTPEVWAEIVQLYKSELVQRRLAGNANSWMFNSEEPDPNRSYFWIDSSSEHDTTALKEAVKRMFEGEEYARKVKEAVEFVSNGGRFYFTYDPTDRRYEEARGI